MKYAAHGKQVMTGRTHVADARDGFTANLIADALNAFDSARDDPPTGPGLFDTTDIDAEPIPGTRHQVRQESDEYACSCGARWDVHDGEEHP